MKLHHLKVPSISKHHIDVRCEQANYFSNPWHFHDELELTYIIKSRGTKFIGDHSSEFKPGEIVLIGSRLPHYWRNSTAYYDSKEKKAKAIIIRFNKNFAGNDFFRIPLMKPIDELFKIATRGILIEGETNLLLQKMIPDLIDMDESHRIIFLIEILLNIASQKQFKLLCSIGYSHQYKGDDMEKIDAIYSYVLDNYMNEISVQAIAARCNMNTAAFCRYFKRKTGKTFKDFMNEIRVGQASKLLLKGDTTIAEAAFASGFNNPSYFNRLFKRINSTTPKHFQKEYINPNQEHEN